MLTPRRMLSVAIAALVTMLVAFAVLPDAAATHWIATTDVSVSPSSTRASRTVLFTVRVENHAAEALTVCDVDIEYQWDATVYSLFTGSEDIPGGGNREWTHSEGIPALQPAFYAYTVTLSALMGSDLLCTANDWVGSIDVRANQPPRAAFAYAPTQIDTSMDVRFTSQSSDADNDPLSWRWDFGDGATSNLENPTHRFLSPGIVHVNLTVTDADGASNSEIQTIRVDPPPLGGGPRIAGLGAWEWAIVAAVAAVGIAGVAYLLKRRKGGHRWGTPPADRSFSKRGR